MSLLSAGIAYFAGLRQSHEPPQTGLNGVAEAVTSVQTLSQEEIDHLISTLFELTSHVDSQVSEHSVRVGEITDSLEQPHDVEANLVVIAGKLLLAANQRLQADLEEAKNEIQTQRDQMAAFMQESRTDPLTCLPNRRALDHELIRVLAQKRRQNLPFSLLMIDIDRFKGVNDVYGHMVGDQILKSIARCLRSTLRESDFLARYGGEEFVAILPNTVLVEACKIATRVRTEIAAYAHNAGELELRITASIGVNEVKAGETDAALIQRADVALYASKNAGRNCCHYHDDVTCHRYEPEPSNTGVRVDSQSEVDEISKKSIAEKTTIHPLLRG